MPYELNKTRGGFFVVKKDSKEKFSKKPLPRERAVKQLRALYFSEKK